MDIFRNALVLRRYVIKLILLFTLKRIGVSRLLIYKIIDDKRGIG